jgi:hypothetical protein
VDLVEVVDRYTVKFVLKEPYGWLLDALAPTSSMPCSWCSAISKTSASRQS